MFAAPEDVMLDDFSRVGGLEDTIREKFPEFERIDFYSVNRYFNLNASDFDEKYNIHYIQSKH